MLLPLHQNDANAKAQLVKGTMVTKNSYPFIFDVKFTKDGLTKTYTLRPSDRLSRKGLEENRTCRLSGGYHAAVYIGLLGDTGSGKTCFQFASRTMGNVSRLEKLIGAQIETEFNADIHEKHSSSPLGTFCGTPLSVVLDRRREIDVCMIDTAGELFRRHSSDTILSIGGADDAAQPASAAEREVTDQLIRNVRLFDACLLVQKGSALLTNRMTRIRMDNYILEMLSPHVLTAIIVTEARLIQGQLCERERCPNQLDQGPLLRSSSPVFRQVSDREGVERHVAVAHSVYEDLAGKTANAVFLIDSLREEGQTQIYADGLNVELPLGWILSRVTASVRIRDAKGK